MSEYFALRKCICVPAILITIVLLALLPARATDQLESSASWTDEFQGPALAPRWSWAREDPTHWSLSARPGYLRIITQTGGIYESTEEQKNLLLMPVPRRSLDNGRSRRCLSG
jgi:hypothetical protein